MQIYTADLFSEIGESPNFIFNMSFCCMVERRQHCLQLLVWTGEHKLKIRLNKSAFKIELEGKTVTSPFSILP